MLGAEDVQVAWVHLQGGKVGYSHHLRVVKYVTCPNINKPYLKHDKISLNVEGKKEYQNHQNLAELGHIK